MEKLEKENVLGVVNFDVLKPTDEEILLSDDICNENINDEKARSLLDGINLSMNLNVPQNQLNLANSDNVGSKAIKHQSLSEQIAGVLSKTVDVSDEGDLVGNSSVVENNFDAVLRDRLEALEAEKLETDKSFQQQASSILHFKAYCKSLTNKLEDAEAKLESERSEAATTLETEVGVLKDQLKSHVDSLRILVEEKSRVLIHQSIPLNSIIANN
jgi:hypothetical protein